MFRGSTPTHTFHLPVDTSTLKMIRITYKQLSRTVLEKTEADVEKDGATVTLTLTQEETLKFHNSGPVLVQLKVLTDLDTVLHSPIFQVSAEEALNTEVLK